MNKAPRRVVALHGVCRGQMILHFFKGVFDSVAHFFKGVFPRSGNHTATRATASRGVGGKVPFFFLENHGLKSTNFTG